MKKFLLIGLILCMIFTMAACGGAGSSDTDATAGGAAKAAPEFTWKLLGVYGRGTSGAEIEDSYAKMVTELSNGRLKVDYYAAGELAGQGSVLELVQNGTVEMGGDWPGYWIGLNTAFEPLGTSVLNMSGFDFLVWYESGGGREIYNEIYGEYGLKFIGNTVTMTESGVRSNVPINSIEDFKGLQVRVGGLSAPMVMKKLGANPVTVAGSELYEAMQKGVIDAFEYGQPTLDYTSGMYETAKYWSLPAWHQTGSLVGIMVNEDAYNALPPELQLTLEVAGDYVMTHISCLNIWDDSEATQAIMDYGCEITYLSDEDLKIIQGYRDEVVQQLCDENALYKKVIESQIDYMKRLAPTRERLGEFGFGKTTILEIK